MTDRFRRPELQRSPAPAKTSPSTATPPHDKVEVIMPDQYADRRAEPRFACDDRGALLFLSEKLTIPCRILDQSASGARVAMDSLDSIPAEIWLIDLDTHTVRRGTAVWSMANRMGLKFNFIQKLAEGQARPPKVPQDVFAAWLRLSGGAGGDDDNDVLYFD